MSVSESKNCEWENFPSPAFRYCSNPHFVNDDELIVCAATSCEDGIFKFHIPNHKWTKFMQYPKGVRLTTRSMAYDKNNNAVYFIISLPLLHLGYTMIKSHIIKTTFRQTLPI